MKMLRNKKGFSLIELVVAIGILSTLVFVASSVYEPVADTSKECVLITNCGKVKSILESELVGVEGLNSATAETWLIANIDGLIARADIVNVFSVPKGYQTVNGLIENICGEVIVTSDALGYFELKGLIHSDGTIYTYAPVPSLRVRW